MNESGMEYGGTFDSGSRGERLLLRAYVRGVLKRENLCSKAAERWLCLYLESHTEGGLETVRRALEGMSDE